METHKAMETAAVEVLTLCPVADGPVAQGAVDDVAVTRGRGQHVQQAVVWRVAVLHAQYPLSDGETQGVPAQLGQRGGPAVDAHLQTPVTHCVTPVNTSHT